ncbi:helix-turn-helix domain-containing protein [Streptococcus suis]|uniref:Helix-turn-helix domain-containing protein n=1 Tax=Streptococcus suivaginalis TaxID=3028082 RepID=A0AA97A0Z6_9STRE|nr:helix-turn-helix domain-containing protein [Streptococcus sp. 29896]MCK4028619.1 helix-turn-helix domain-containing protein [Streptococcus suis]WNY47989.1 helix-turn-helix domain-containing protein [Streptococcus sp. 29896]
MNLKISFSPLWRKIASLNMTQKELQTVTGLGSSTLTNLRNDDCVTTDTILKLCIALQCELNEIIELTGDNDDKK